MDSTIRNPKHSKLYELTAKEKEFEKFHLNKLKERIEAELNQKFSLSKQIMNYIR